MLRPFNNIPSFVSKEVKAKLKYVLCKKIHIKKKKNNESPLSL
jgi:hypothetical protein